MNERMNEKDFFAKIAKGAGFLAASSVLGYALGFIYNIISARWLSPADFGALSIFRTVLGVGGMIAILGGGGATTKYISEWLAENKNISPLVSTSIALQLLTGIAIAAAIYATSNFVAVSIFKAAALAPLLKITAIVLFIHQASNIFLAFLLGYERFDLTSFTSVSEKIGRLAVTAILLYLGFGLMGAVYGIIAGSVFMFLYSFAMFYRLHPTFNIKFHRETAKMLVWFSVPIFLTTAAFTINSTVDTFVLGRFTDVTTIGFYSIAVAMVGFVGAITGIVGTVLFPAFSRLHASDDHAMKERIINMIVKYSFYLVIPAAVGMFLLAEPAIRLLYGSSYTPAAHILQSLSLAAIFYPMFHVPNAYLTGSGRPREMMKAGFAAVIVNALLDVLLVPSFGVLGAVIAMTSAGAVYMFIGYYYVSKHVKLQFNYLWKIGVSTALLFAAVLAIRSQFVAASYVKLAVIAIAGALIYGASMFLLRSFEPSEIDILKDLLMRSKRKLPFIRKTP